jgi:DNA recombination protein Rad52
MDWDKASEHLKAPLDPRAIKPPPQGKYGEYVDGLHVIREANRIFGFNGWSYEVTRLELVSRVDAQNNNVRVGYLCAVRVNVDGVVREGTAVGNGAAKPDNEADAHESAVKEAETDALKRALRSFGNTFGLALYDKDKSAREVGIPPEPFNAPATRDRIKAAIGKAANAIALEQLWTHPKTCEAFDQLPPPMQAELTHDYTTRMGAVYQAPPEAAE